MHSWLAVCDIDSQGWWNFPVVFFAWTSLQDVRPETGIQETLLHCCTFDTDTGTWILCNALKSFLTSGLRAENTSWPDRTVDWIGHLTLTKAFPTRSSFSSQQHAYFRERLTARAPSFQLDTYILSSKIKVEMLIWNFIVTYITKLWFWIAFCSPAPGRRGQLLTPCP